MPCPFNLKEAQVGIALVKPKGGIMLHTDYPLRWELKGLRTDWHRQLLVIQRSKLCLALPNQAIYQHSHARRVT